ncbi:MAG TPA: VanW family protein [Thermomicrobiales bacterium]|nr:VanW family protein [Thermomicrobiales bacterium]
MPWATRLGRLIPRLLLVLALALLVAAIALFTFRAIYVDKVYPAIAVGDVSVGGMTVEQAVATVEQRAAELERGTVTFTYNGQTWTPTLAELGASIDVESSVDAAWELGRDESAVDRLGFTRQLLHGDQRVPLRTMVDLTVLAGWFEQVNADIDQRAVNADMVVDGTEVSISPEKSGIIVDEDAATELILGALESLEPVSTEMPTTTEVPKIFADDLEGLRSDLAIRLDDPMVAVFEGQEWEIPPAELTEFLTVETTYENGATRVDVGFERDGLTAYLRNTFSGKVNRSPVDARIAWSAADGGLISLEQSVDGAALRSNAFADAVAESFLSDQALIEIPAVVTKPEVDSNNLGALGIDGRISRATSNFAGGSESRDTNISVGTRLLNGELIAPGEEFSFNGAVGEITYDKGFVDGSVIEAGIIGRSVGGGICQVTTTVFRAALLSGMPITEWWPHSLRLLGYERNGWTAGYDASILQSGSDPALWADFKFKNDTDGYMIVHAWNEYPYNIVEIYGSDDGRTMEVGDAQFSTPNGKYAAWFTRMITYPDGTRKECTFESVYK